MAYVKKNRKAVERLLAGLLGSFFFATFAFSAENAGTSGAAFLKVGVGARAVGMGEAQVAVPEGSDALCWNVAGLTNLRKRDISFTHNEWIDDIRYEHVGASLPVLALRSAVGLSYSQLTMGELEGRDEQGRPTGTFTAGDRLFAVGWAVRPSGFLQGGVTFKYITSHIGEDKASAYAADLGLIIAPPLDGLSAGFALQNLGTRVTFVNESDPLPLTTRAGIGYTILFGEKTYKLTFAADWVKGNDTRHRVNTGTEFWLADTVALRAGYKGRYDEDGITAGGGFKHFFASKYGLQFDYAYANMGVFGATHRVSVTAILGPAI